MTATVEQMAVVLDRLAHAFPPTQVDETTLELWVTHVGAAHPVDVIAEAVELWIATQERFPSIARFGATCRQVQRLRLDAEMRSRGVEAGSTRPSWEQAAMARILIDGLRFAQAHRDEWATDDERDDAIAEFVDRRRREEGLL